MSVEDDINLAEDERKAIEELRQRLGKDLDSMKKYNETTLLYRFLKARDWSVNQAEVMLKKAIEWRKQNGMDTIATDYKAPEFVMKYYGNMHIGYDIEDKCPVFYQPSGKIDAHGLFNSAKQSDLMKWSLQMISNMEDYLEKNCKKINSGFVYILDQKDLSFANATHKKGTEFVIKLVKILQDIHPERLKAVYIINAPALFTFPYKIIKNFVAASVMNKVHMYGTDGWQEELLKVMDADQLPAFLGGKRTDPDGNPLCKTIVQQAGKVDEKYYIHRSKCSLADSPGVEKIVISQASFLEKPLQITEPGSIIEWEFETKTRDIGFGLFYKEMDGDEEKMVELVSLQRLETDEFSETGMFKCDKAGEYIILFDNSYSWVRSKEIFYRITIVNPTEHEKRFNTE